MMLVLDPKITEEQKGDIRRTLCESGHILREIVHEGRQLIGAVGAPQDTLESFQNLPGVTEVVAVPTAFKLVSRQMHPEDTLVAVGDRVVGAERLAVIAGPCAIESRDQALTIARRVHRYGAVLYRGGAFKPRSSPYAFQGLAEEGLRILAEVRKTTGMPVVTEITAPDQAEAMPAYVDVVQVGARNMQNFELLRCVGRLGMPVLLKRGLSATIEEWLMSAEYILAEGNDQVILCERGIRTFEPYTRNTLDLSAIPVLKNLTHLPVIIDPSHATGMREKVSPMARAAVAAGADGLIIEVHHDPDRALSDGPQSLYPEQFARLMRELYVIAPVVDRQIGGGYLEDSAPCQAESRSGSSSPPRAAFFGEAGTHSHRACMRYFGNASEVLPQPTFRAVFESVQQGAATYGIVPLENSLCGSIHENYDLLLEFDLQLIGEITLRIVHHLIGHPGATPETITRVLAPPPVLQQCRRFLDTHRGWEEVPAASTASAVRILRDRAEPATAAIGSRQAAAIYGMEILSEAIETNPRNFTRFGIIGHTSPKTVRHGKTSVIFSTDHRPGALYRVLQVFAAQEINLVKLESRPIHGKRWEYMFYADLRLDPAAAGADAMLDEVRRHTEFLRVLGSY